MDVRGLPHDAVQDQVRLPPSVAFEVVLQGIRIRLGRSLITITGVVCGIAFLMSILTGQLIREGVGAEDEIRHEVARIRNFMRAELPPLADRTVGLVTAGPVAEAQMRVLEELAAEGVAAIQTLEGRAPALPRVLGRVAPVEAARFGRDATAILLVGEGDPPALPWREILARGRPAALASTLPAERLPALPADQLVLLARTPTDEENEARAAQERRDAARNLWIGIISLLVTVMGIANAMLMSVTERFREIGTMKCLGALSGFVRQMFMMESCLMGLAGGIAGAVAGALFSVIMYAGTYGAGLVLSSLPLLTVALYGILSVLAGIGLSMVAAIYPAQVAARMVPASALRSNV